LTSIAQSQHQEADIDLSIVIPCYNEVGNVPGIQREFFPVATQLAKSHSLEAIFVDDGSTDGTRQVLGDALDNGCLPRASVRFECHPVNRGLGAALRTGFAAARGRVIVTTDSDGTYRFSEIPALLSYLTHDIDMVTASPYHPAGSVESVSAYRLILSRGSSAIYRLLVDWRVHTYTCLFRAYRRQVIERVLFESDGFLAGTELLVKAMLMGYRVAEYPTELHSRVSGVSKAKLVPTVLAHLGFQMRVLSHRLNLAPLAELDKAPGVHG
jgi:dolichol-phosphate mannosyltransferase